MSYELGMMKSNSRLSCHGRRRAAALCPPSRVILCLCLFLAIACDEKSPIGPTVPIDQPFVLAPGEDASITEAKVWIRFEGVASDSRCPIDAFCVQAGDAVVMIGVFDDAGSFAYELHTSDARRKNSIHRNVSIEIVELQPYPRSNQRTDPSAYRATFKVTRS